MANIQKIIQYLHYHFNQELSLTELAKHAFLSPFHFQRVFKEAVGETPKQYLIRVRLETAAHFIVLKPKESILAVAIDCGYNSLESFSRAFKNFYSVSPDIFRKMNEQEKLEVLHNKIKSGRLENNPDLLFSVPNQKSIPNNLSIKVVKLPSMKFIYSALSLESTEQITERFKKVKQWAEVRELTSPDSQLFGIFMDYPLFTALDKCRYLACISVNTKPELNGNIQYMELPIKTYVSLEVYGSISEMIQQITVFSNTWLPESGYELVHEPAFHFPGQDIIKVPFKQNSFYLHLRIQPR